ncbi:hypothetical protein K2173_013576 [Erythroxylum novogranatense]|uniref:Uncharacterized protein n=1 Tax=Erythroxylum novogranatense TaxID=1862640 RepID=A0AAV8TM43_9ROSI|nr:hypothetical protein K2173_013576 [Erythroxylum novogranatense]
MEPIIKQGPKLLRQISKQRQHLQKDIVSGLEEHVARASKQIEAEANRRFEAKLTSVCNHAVHLGGNSGVCSSKFQAVSLPSSSIAKRFMHRQISQLVKPNGNRAFLVDTLGLVRRLEAQGVPSKQAEAITAAITEVLNDSLENVSHSFVSKPEMQKSEMIQESNLSKFKSEVRSDIDKMRSELRRIRDELANQNAETTNLTNKLDREIHALRAQLEAAKYDVIKYCIGTLVSISAVGLAVVRILM